MKISELIEMLETIEKHEGDLQVYADFLPINFNGVKTIDYEDEVGYKRVVNIE